MTTYTVEIHDGTGWRPAPNHEYENASNAVTTFRYYVERGLRARITANDPAKAASGEKAR